MQWNQIKTLFIVCFLVLDVYLLFQYLDKRKDDNLHVKEQQETSIETHLKNENIKVGNLPEEVEEETFIEVRQHLFTEEEVSEIESLNNQEFIVKDQSFVAGKFEERIPVPLEATNKEIEELLQNHIFGIENYKFWTWNKELNVIAFFQVKKGRPVYYNQNGLVLVFLNNKNEIDFYTQKMLGEPEEQKEEKKELIKALQAVEVLYRVNELEPGDEITKANLGFYTRTPFLSGVQVFVPTWKVTVNDEKHYFVNALEGLSYPSDDQDFLNRVIKDTSDELTAENTGVLNYINERLKTRLEYIEKENK